MMQPQGLKNRPSTGIAPLPRLPPSPDHASSSDQPSPADGFNLGDRKSTVQEQESVSRLRSAANYSPFDPQALACSPPTYAPHAQSHQQYASDADYFSSLGAIAGDHGIALFRTSRPDIPLLVLSHSVGRAGGIKNMAFEPSMESMYLAASRGNGLLIWDASGHSLSPLLGRLALESTFDNGEICSMDWKKNEPIIAMATPSETCLWDLRTALGTRASKPSLRFFSSALPLVQVACSHRNECATMDQAGVVRIHDLRVTSRSATQNPRQLSSFESYKHAGIGLSSFRTNNDESCWMTWGLDSPKSDAIVKVWSQVSTSAGNKSEESSLDQDPFRHSDVSPDRSPVGSSHSQSLKRTESSTCNQIAQFTMPYLACARICPDPFENSIVTVGLTKTAGWKAELWKLNQEEDDAVSDATETFGVEKLLSFEEDRGKMQIFSPNHQMGSLLGAELALSQSPMPIGKIGPNDEWELLLCCMSEDGYVTTSVVTQAPSSRTASIEGISFSDRSSLRYFPAEQRGNFTLDAASALKTRPSRNSLDGSRHAYAPDAANLPLSNEVSSDSEIKSPPLIQRDGTAMPFDMDTGYGLITTEAPVVGSATGTVVSTNGEDVELSIQNPRLPNRMTSDRVPCPRICGATFTSAPGGLLVFSNGQIKKMWDWYQTSDSRRTSSGPKSASGPEKNSLYPRIKKDLDDMTRAAKEAQWGKDNEGQENGDNDSDGSIDLFDDEVSSDEDGELEDSGSQIDQEGKGSPDGMYQNYFGGRQRPISYPRQSSKFKDEEVDTMKQLDNLTTPQQNERLRQSTSFDGPSSDLLTPSVVVSYDTMRSMYNGQSVVLAEHMLLGDWHPIADTDDSAKPQETTNDLPAIDGATETVVSTLQSNPKNQNSRFRPLHMKTLSGFTPPRRTSDTAVSPLSPTRSDPQFRNASPFGGPPFVKSTITRDDEAVHGGEYSARPRRDESIVILRKLLVPTPYQNLISPPDSNMLPSKLMESPASEKIKRSSSSNAILQTVKASMNAIDQDDQNGGMEPQQSVTVVTRFGVYTLPALHVSKQEQQESPNTILKLICLHNSSVCHQHDQEEKANTWSIIARAIDNCSDDRWGGAPAMGRELVGGLLQYYESVGDVQMVATLVCVLSAGQRNGLQNRHIVSLLPGDQDAKYDLYIRRYAELVYRWGLLTKRVELHKHLSHHLGLTDGAQILPPVGGVGEKAPGISFSITCPHCRKDTEGGNVCSSCNDYAFRCILCDNAVKGLFTVCSLCGHGGHMNHLLSWFDEEKTCPSGCGCSCLLVMSGRHQVSMADATGSQ